MAKTKIEWAEEVWNPITGCTKISEGCKHCYAERFAKRMRGRFGYSEENPFQITFHRDRISQPTRWRKPRKVFVCSMGDLFHESVPFEWIDEVMYFISLGWWHTFLILTKRPHRMREYFSKQSKKRIYKIPTNVWLGVSVENQQRAEERIPDLLRTGDELTKRFVSIEPMLGPIDLKMIKADGFVVNALSGMYGAFSPIHPFDRKLNWVIVGGESGPNARPIQPDWIRKIRDQCLRTNIPFFFKQWGGKNKKKNGRLLDGRTWEEFPGLL